MPYISDFKALAGVKRLAEQLRVGYRPTELHSFIPVVRAALQPDEMRAGDLLLALLSDVHQVEFKILEAASAAGQWPDPNIAPLLTDRLNGYGLVPNSLRSHRPRRRMRAAR